ncbi:hypothetical protein GBF38_009073, partial [Nibea albiflora]
WLSWRSWRSWRMEELVELVELSECSEGFRFELLMFVNRGSTDEPNSPSHSLNRD